MKSQNFRAEGWCDVHQKLLYSSRRKAKAVARLHHGEHKGVYQCTVQDTLFHVGGLAHRVIDGTYSREDFYGHAS